MGRLFILIALRADTKFNLHHISVFYFNYWKLLAMKKYTKKTSMITSIGLVLLLQACAGTSSQQLASVSDEQNTLDEKQKIQPTQSTKAFEDYRLATELARYAQEQKDPGALLVAAQMMKKNPTQKVTRKKQNQNTGDVKEKQSGQLPTADTLLSQAKLWAEDDLQLIALIEKEQKVRGSRGRTYGPSKQIERVNPRSTDYYKIKFDGMEVAEIAIIGDGDNDLDCTIYDENGNLVDSDTDSSDTCALSFIPMRDGLFTLKIKNLGYDVYSEYALITN